MRKLIVEPTSNTPEITLDPTQGYFSITGRSFPENSRKFYTPILDWFDAFDPMHSKNYRFNFNLNYINSSSIISLFELLKKLSKIKKNTGCSFDVEWMHESDDETIRKIGEDFTKLTDMPLTLKVVHTQ